MAKAKIPKSALAHRKKTSSSQQQKSAETYKPSCSPWHAPPPLPSFKERVELAKSKQQSFDNYLNLTPDRHFDLTKYAAGIQLWEVEVPWGHWVYVACPTAKTKCPECHSFPYHRGCLLVAIDGKCESEAQASKSQPRASMAVFFGPENCHNIAVDIDEERHTAQVAELKACIAALVKSISVFQEEDKNQCERDQTWPLHTLVIKSHSAYIVQGVTEWLPKWKANGWKNCKGQAVANDPLWRLLDVWVRHLEADVQVLFWLVPRTANTVAESMATWVLSQPRPKPLKKPIKALKG